MGRARYELVPPRQQAIRGVVGRSLRHRGPASPPPSGSMRRRRAPSRERSVDALDALRGVLEAVVQAGDTLGGEARKWSQDKRSLPQVAAKIILSMAPQ
ncbi:hypothetical protein SAMD00023353_9900200 [Rosellinia necatrix]|uniref:Uncharacterized protein n=1 Tax=Rosellinia necatrix TaxID=77044 RepID=A0A1W2TWD0_ROSNE|nr:hypothetical protein SAMD00023353_9900200 [Rosellinia necatrix]